MRNRRRAAGMIGLAACAAALAGCASGGQTWALPDLAHVFTPAPPIPNPMPVQVNDFDVVWNKTVAEVNRHFPMASENRLARTMRTDTLLTGTLIEPWTRDTVTFHDRFEATLQTMRRFAEVHIDPAPAGGYLIKVQVHKELEDLTKPASQPAGRASYYNDFPVNRTREVVGTVQAPVGWIRVGRDTGMEQQILAEIRDALLL